MLQIRYGHQLCCSDYPFIGVALQIRGTERSHMDPPIRSAVAPITYSAYTRATRDHERRRLRREDHLNTADIPFLENEIVFVKHEASTEDGGYKLPLSVARVTKVLDNGSRADVMYLTAGFWKGTWVPFEFKRRKVKGRLEPRRFWSDTIGKEGVVLMRGGLTNAKKLNGKTLKYLSELPESLYDVFISKASAQRHNTTTCTNVASTDGSGSDVDVEGSEEASESDSHSSDRESSSEEDGDIRSREESRGFLEERRSKALRHS